MTTRRVTFEHDGHRFEAMEQSSSPAIAGAPPQLKWEVRMDGAPALEFMGEFPYRDEDVRKRVIEWYGIQKPV